MFFLLWAPLSPKQHKTTFFKKHVRQHVLIHPLSPVCENVSCIESFSGQNVTPVGIYVITCHGKLKEQVVCDYLA